MSFVHALRQTLSLPAWLSKTPPPPVPAAPPVSRKLSRLLQGHARIGGPGRPICVNDFESWLREDPCEFKLFVEEIGPSLIQFHTPRDLHQGQTFQLDLLLPCLGPCKAIATVDWTLASSGGYRIQATLKADPDNAAKLRMFSELDWERGR